METRRYAGIAALVGLMVACGSSSDGSVAPDAAQAQDTVAVVDATSDQTDPPTDEGLADPGVPPADEGWPPDAGGEDLATPDPGGTDDVAPPDTGLDGTTVPITLDVLWVGYYAETSDFLDTLGADAIGPTVAVAGTTVEIGWRAAVYEDCREPDGLAVTQDGASLTFTLENTDPIEICNDSDYVANVAATVELPGGTWEITLAAEVKGFWVDNGDPQTSTIEVPGPE